MRDDAGVDIRLLGKDDHAIFGDPATIAFAALDADTGSPLGMG